MKVKGTIFDIQRNALNDGPGIRTTVFMKGCPLRCVWCHNPEARSSKPQLSFSEADCQNCFTCITTCRNDVHQVINDEHYVNFDRCEADGYCVKNCPFNAVEVIGKNMSVEEVMEIVLKDIAFYDKSEGGLTISGGEPMSQFNFISELLKEAKENKIHTCLDTSGYAKPGKFEEILPLVDLFLFDYKETDPNRHHEFTGVNQQLILKNLDLLYQHKKEVLLRCPIIPGYNDSETHFQGIAHLSQKYNMNVEIMPFHNMANGKVQKYGLESVLPEIDNVSTEQLEHWIFKLNSLKCKVINTG